MKQKLSIQEQVNHMNSKGIQFNLTSEKDAEKFISCNTYYFKIKAYAKNFVKNKQDKYVNLEFAYLKELSMLDMHLRRIILNIALNIEHAIKTKINTNLCNNLTENGYSIVHAFRENVKYEDVKANRYTKSMIAKYEPDYALWNYLEMISFGTLWDFYNFYYSIYDSEQATKANPFLYCVKIMRNIAAHNNCLLNNLTKKNIIPINKLTAFLNQNKDFSPNQIKKFQIPVIHDFTAILYTFNLFIDSPEMINNTFIELDELMNRMQHNINYFDKHLQIKSNLKFFQKIVDFFKKVAYTNITEQKSN